MRVLPSDLLIASLLGMYAASARAEPNRGAADTRDRFELSAQSDSYVQLFRRALLPGPNGSLVASDTAAPFYEYAAFRARDLDTPWRKDSLDLELALWGRAWFDARHGEQLFD